MLSELVEAAQRFRAERELPARSTKRRRPTWVIEVDETGQGRLLGPYKRDDHRPLRAPDRHRSGRISAENLKPYLLMDDGRYALGIPEPGREDEAALAHGGFVRLLEEAHQCTQDRDLGHILQFLAQPLPDKVRSQIAPKDVVTFKTASGEFPCEREAVQHFWSDHLARELKAAFPATCAVCGRHGTILQLLPTEVVIMGQKCQVT